MSPLTIIAEQQAAAEQKVLAYLRKAGATYPDAAVALEPGGDREIHEALQRLLFHGEVRESTPTGRYWVDQQAIATSHKFQRSEAQTFVAGVSVVLGILVLWFGLALLFG